MDTPIPPPLSRREPLALLLSFVGIEVPTHLFHVDVLVVVVVVVVDDVDPFSAHFPSPPNVRPRSLHPYAPVFRLPFTAFPFSRFARSVSCSSFPVDILRQNPAKKRKKKRGEKGKKSTREIFGTLWGVVDRGGSAKNDAARDYGNLARAM